MRSRFDRQFRFPFRVHRSTFIVCFLASLFSLSMCVAFGNAQEKPKSTIQEWQINGILAALDDGYSGVKREAFEKLVKFDAAALKAFPKQSEEIGKRASDLVKNSKEDSYLRISSAKVLGVLGKTNDRSIQALTEIFNNDKESTYTQISAAEALENLGKTNDRSVQILTEILNSTQEDTYFRISAAEALAKTDKTNDRAVQVLTEILNDSKERAIYRSQAAKTLGASSKNNDRTVQILTEILNNTKEDTDVQISAAEALGELGKTNNRTVQILTEILNNTKEKSYIRVNAAEALRNLGKTNNRTVQILTEILNNTKEDSTVRISAANLLVNLEKTDNTTVQTLTEILRNSKEYSYNRTYAAEALGKFKQLTLGEVFVFINSTHDRQIGNFDGNRFSSYFYSRGENKIRILLKWIGLPRYESIPTQLAHDEGRKTLEAFAQAWEPSRDFRESRTELARAIADVAKMVQWRTSDIPLLQQHYNNLKDAKSNSADSVEAAINSLTVWKYINQFRNTVAAHLAFWVMLIFAYPKYSWIQAIFFWNPWIRNIGGAIYISFLLSWVPFLRHKLFEPFRDSLLADAKLHSFNPKAYFLDSEVTLKGTDERQPLQTVFPEIKGQFILEGDSGLGKTFFLRYLVKASKRIVVYLPAQKCEKGVIEAIQAKLHGQAQDADFLRNLIYSGAIDICIDGLNEVSADTRATIAQFIEQFFKGNILMTTQPLEWTPPSTAKTYVLQPLRTDQIKSFLVSRQAIMPVSETYEQDCDRYIQSALSPNQPTEERIAAHCILSNPMDLTIVAQMLAQGRTPDLFRLQEQQYTLMANEYRQIYSSEFPLKPFSEAVYQRRLNDEPALPANEFYNEIICMEDDKHKMVISRQWKDTKGEIQKEWYFRHDKIAEFFIVQTFLGDSETAQTRMYEHLGDPRFRGVYFLLATFLSIDAAQALRETLIQYAADTKDHTVSDTFVQLLRTRKA